MLRGALTALVTPFDSQGKIDKRAFCDLIEWQISEGIHGLVPGGTTGESATLDHQEHCEIIQLCIEQTRGRVPVIAGAGSNSTAEAIHLARFAQEAGADAILSVTPYYNKPNQRGLYAHFSAIAQEVSLPILIYNIPPRSVIDLLPDTMAALARDHKNIVGVKDATGHIERVAEHRHKCPRGFLQFSGDDNTALGFNAQGGVGCISVVSNVAPNLVAQMQDACLRGDYHKALAINDRLAPLNKALFLEPNPTGIKYVLERVRGIPAFLRKPMVAVEKATQTILEEALAHAGLLSWDCHEHKEK